MESVPAFNWVFAYQSITSKMLTQSSRYKRAESSLLADEKDPQQWVLVVVWVIHLYLYINYQKYIIKGCIVGRGDRRGEVRVKYSTIKIGINANLPNVSICANVL